MEAGGGQEAGPGPPARRVGLPSGTLAFRLWEGASFLGICPPDGGWRLRGWEGQRKATVGVSEAITLGLPYWDLSPGT